MKKINLTKLYELIFNRTSLIVAISLWIFVQLILVITYNSNELVGDSGLYVYYATECARNGTMYPDWSNYHNQYVFAPGWVNFLVLCIKCFGSVWYVPYINIIFNVGILYFIYKIAIQLSNKNRKVAYIAIYMFVLLPSNTNIVMLLYSELLFELLATASFYLILKRKFTYLAIAGLLISLAYWTRPLALAWIIAAVCFLWLSTKRFAPIAIYLCTFVFTCGVIGVSTHQNFPDYLCTSSTGGVNLIMGANDLATGLYCIEARQEGGLGYLPGLYETDEFTPVKDYYGDSLYMSKFTDRYTYSECDSIWKARSVEWIIENPIKWISMLPIKTYYLLHAVSPFSPLAGWDNHILAQGYKKVSYLGTLFSKMLMLLFIGGCLFCLWRRKEFLYLIAPVIICIGMTIVTVCIDRYNFIMLPNIVIGIALTLKYIKSSTRWGKVI